jgi:hypothetical protein
MSRMSSENQDSFRQLTQLYDNFRDETEPDTPSMASTRNTTSATEILSEFRSTLAENQPTMHAERRYDSWLSTDRDSFNSVTTVTSVNSTLSEPNFLTRSTRKKSKRLCFSDESNLLRRRCDGRVQEPHFFCISSLVLDSLPWVVSIIWIIAIWHEGSFSPEKSVQ